MVFRLLTIGLCTACVILLARETSRPRAMHVQVVQASLPAGRAVTPLSVVDVAAEVAPSAIPKLVRLGRGEWVRAINEERPEDDATAEQWISALAHHGAFLDLTIAGGEGDRRVLLLVH